jgi:hypothetical protein
VSNFCFDCGNQGFEDKVCSGCGRQPKSLNLSHKDEKEAVSFVKKARFLKIPEEYISETWSADKFRRLYKGKNNDGKLNMYLEKEYLEKIELLHNHFSQGFIPRKGALIIAPAYHSKRTLAFSCMQLALDHGHTIAPLLTTLELKRLIVLSAENPRYKMFNEISFDDYIMADIVFVTVTQTEQHKNAYSVLEEIFSMRSAKGLTTIGLSRYTLEELSTWDRKNNLVKLRGLEPEANYKKFPSIIEYREVV